VGHRLPVSSGRPHWVDELDTFAILFDVGHDDAVVRLAKGGNDSALEKTACVSYKIQHAVG
jgi:hypothetical protein